jgi:Tfp pilus assembly protein PilF
VKGERDWVGAEAMYKAALRIKPGDATILVNFGILVQEWQGDWDMAHTWYER